MYWIILTLVVIEIIVLFEARYYLVYYYHMIKNKYNYDKEKNRLLKANIKKRLLKNDEIKKYIEMIIEKLDEYGYHVNNRKYVVDPNLERELRFSKLDDKPTRRLSDSIMDFMDLNKEEIELTIYHTSSRRRGVYAGLYNENKHTIKIEINTYTTVDNLISVIAHECTHHFLLSKGIKIEPRRSNEIFTDLTAVYLGFGDYFYRGYKAQRRLVFDGGYRTLIDGDKLGYIAYGDIKYAMKYIKRRRIKKQ